jgi:general L-amino acid transport system permease protein
MSARRPPPRASASLRGGWNNANVRAMFYQIAVVSIVLVIGGLLIANAQSALSKQGISTGFGFLTQKAGFDIGDKLISFSTNDTFLRAYGVAVLNTAKISVVAMLFATFVGVIVGIGRLSRNPLINKICSAYVEFFRNTPQLVQLIFWYTLITHLPRPRDALTAGGFAFLSNRGLTIPWLEEGGAAFLAAVALLAGLLASGLLSAWSKSRSGKMRFRGRYLLAFPFVLSAFVFVFAGGSLSVSVPALAGFNFRGGTTLSPEFLALLLGLALYIGAFIAEIVRSGIQSVGRGQIEAARTIGLSPFDTYRKIIFPQALRVMIPPAAVQYVSILKNSSLGVAIGYPELFNINNTIVTLSGHTVEAITIMMSIYLGISFLIAALMNVYNRFVQIPER